MTLEHEGRHFVSGLIFVVGTVLAVALAALSNRSGGIVMAQRRGTALTEADQAAAVAKYGNGLASDTEAAQRAWLGGTMFKVTAKGRLDRRARNCYPQPAQLAIPAFMATGRIKSQRKGK